MAVAAVASEAGRPGTAALLALGQPDDARGLVRLAAHLALLAAATALVGLTRGSLWVWPAMLAQGIVQVALFAPLHESVHRTCFRSRVLNDRVADLAGLIVVLPARWYRHFHMAHHRHTQRPGLDPEAPEAKATTLPAYLLHVSGLPYWWRSFRNMARHAAGGPLSPFVPAREAGAVRWEARAHLAIYAAALAAILAGYEAPLWHWLLPALLAQPLLRLYLLAEHVGCPADDDLLVATRTTYTAAPLRFLMWNMPFHAEHHAWPGVPWHALPRANLLAAPHLAETAPGYVAFHRRYLRALRAGEGRRFVLGGVDPTVERLPAA